MRQLFLGLTLLIAGVAIGFLIGRAPRADSSGTTLGHGVARTSTQDVSAAASALEEDLDPVVRSQTRVSAPSVSSGEDSVTELDRALLSMAARFPGPAGDRSLSGRVVDEAGDPIFGATIVVTGPSASRSLFRLALDPATIGRGYDGEARLDPLMRSYAESIIHSLTPAGSSAADANGRFAIEGLAEGGYMVEAYAEDFIFVRTNAAAGDTLELVGKSVTTFELDVVDAAGSSPESATVVVLEKNGADTHFRWNPRAKEIRVTSRLITLQAFVGEVSRVGNGDYRADARSSIQTIDRDTDGRGPHTLELQELPSVLVNVRPSPDAGQPFEPWCDLVRGEQRISVAQLPGKPFIAFDVTAGPYTVEVGRGDGPAEVTREITVAEGRAEVTVELGPLDTSRYLIAHCVDAQGRPVQDIWSFGVSVRTNRSSTGTSIHTKARANGEYWLSLERGMSGSAQISRDTIQSLTLVARSPSQGDVTKIVDPSAGRVEFVFQTPSVLLVQVEGTLDSGLRVWVEVPQEDSERWRRVGQPSNVPGDGSVAFQSLTPGTARIVLEHEDSTSRVPLAVVAIELREGTNKARMEAPQTYDLVVLVPELEDQQFELLAEENGEFERKANARAVAGDRLVFSRLPAGLYRVQYRGKFRSIFADYVVPCGEVVFVPMSIGGFEVTKLAEGCLAQQAGLRVGDVLVGVDHIGPSAEGFILEFTSRVIRPDGTVLRVRRGGAQLELSVRLEAPQGRAYRGLGARFKALAR